MYLWTDRIKPWSLALLLVACVVGLTATARATPSTAAFFAPAKDKGANLPADEIYPRGRLFPFSFFSVGGVTGGIKPDILKALEAVKRDGCTMIGPQYELNDRILKDASSIGLKAIYTLRPLDAHGKPINKDRLTDAMMPQALKSIREQVQKVVQSDMNDQVAWWYIQPEELRWWHKGEITYLRYVVQAVHQVDPERRPVWMYDPNHRNAEALAHTAGTGMDIVGKGMYVNGAGMKDQRVWCRWTIEQEIEAIRKSQPRAIPIAMPEMYDYQPADGFKVDMIPTWARHDVYAALVTGAKGVVIFSLRQRPTLPADAYDAYYKAYAKCATELTGKLHLGQVFLFGQKRNDLSVDVIDGPATVKLLYPNGGVKKPKTYSSLNFLNVAYKDGRYLFIVNAANKPVKAMVGGLPYGNIQVHDLFDGDAKPFRVAEGDFPVTIPALGVVGFRFEQGE